VTLNGHAPLADRIKKYQLVDAANQSDEESDPDEPPMDPVPHLSIPIADVRQEGVSWLWPNYVALGKLTLLDADAGIGKSTMLIDLAARVTTGRMMPDGSRSDLREPSTVLFASGEDSASDTLLPRFRAAEGDEERMHLVRRVQRRHGSLGSEDWVLPTHYSQLRTDIERLDIKLLCIDPLTAFVSRDVNLREEQAVRAALGPLRTIGEETGCAVVLVRHLTKSGKGNALNRGMGAVAIGALARAALTVGRDPDDPTGERCVLVGSKSNIGTLAPGLSFEVVTDQTHNCSLILWGNPVDTSAETLLSDGHDGEGRSEQVEIAEQLQLATKSGPIRVRDAREAIESAGFRASDKTIQRAARRAGLVTETTGTFPGIRYWRRRDQLLPSVDTPETESASSEPVPTELTRDDMPQASSVDTVDSVSTLDDPASSEVAQ
jgi:hypothetical protein